MTTDANQYQWRHLWSVPCALTFARFPLAIAFLLARARPTTQLVILLAAGLTDLLDGWVARRWNQQTATGAALDGLVDKFFVLLVVLSLFLSRALPLWQMLLLGLRDLGEALLLVFLRVAAPLIFNVGKPHASRWSKLTTVAQFTTIIAALLQTHTLPFVLLTGALSTITIAGLLRELQATRQLLPPR